MLGLLMCGLVAPAWAAAVVVYDGEVGPEYRAAVADAGLDPWEAQARRFSELGAAAAPALWASSAGRYTPVQAPACGRPEANADLREVVRIAEGHLNYRRYGEAGAALDRAAERLGCLGEPAEASLAGRIALLRGVVRAQSGDRDGAVRAFAEARAWQPDLRWTDEFDPALRAWFDAAAAPAGASAQLTLGPGATEGGAVWIDGRRPVVSAGEVTLAPGRHLVQVLGGERASTWPVDTAAGDLLLVHPAGFTDRELARAIEPASQAVYALAIHAAVGRGTDVFLRVDGATYRVGPDGVQRLRSVTPAAARACAAPARCTARWLLGGGVAGIAVGGGVAAWASVLEARHAGDVADFETLDPGGTASAILVTAYSEDLVEAQGERAAMRWGGVGVAGAGAVSLVVGLVLDQRGAREGVATAGDGRSDAGSERRAHLVVDYAGGVASLRFVGAW